MADPDPDPERELIGDGRVLPPKARPSILEMLAALEKSRALVLQGPFDAALIRPDGRPGPCEP